MPTRHLYRTVLPAASLLLLWLAAAPASLSAAPGRADPEGPAAPVLVARGDDFLVHAAPYPAGHEGWGPGGLGSPGGYLLLHTKPSTGRLHLLMLSGSRLLQRRNAGYQESRFAGLAADGQRLYALLWFRESAAPPGTRPFQRPGREDDGRRRGAAAEAPDPGRYRLFVFGLADGKRLTTLGVPSVPHDAEPAEEVAGKGPLQLIDGGVSVHGKEFKFDPVDRAKVEAPADPARPPRDDAPNQPTLVAKADDALVHAAPYLDNVASAPAEHPRAGVVYAHVLVHTKPSTGEMKTLVSTGTTAIPTRRLSYHHSRLSGVAVDVPNDRLWVLTWFVTTWDRPPGFEGDQLRGRAPGHDPEGRCNLQLFRLSDGESIPHGGPGPRELKGKPGGGVPAPTVGAGGLEIIEGGVSVFGTPIKVKDRPKPADAPPAAPVPGPGHGPAEGEDAGAKLRGLIEQLKDPQEHNRAFAIAGLEQLGDPAAVEPLIAVIDDRRALPGTDNWVGAAAVRALATLTGNKGPVQSFEKQEWEAWWGKHKAEYLNRRPEEK